MTLPPMARLDWARDAKALNQHRGAALQPVANPVVVSPVVVSATGSLLTPDPVVFVDASCCPLDDTRV
jgi:hypothetical protein